MNRKSIPDIYRAYKSCGGAEAEKLKTVSETTGYSVNEIKAIAALYAAKANTLPYRAFKFALPKNGPYFEYSVVVPVDKNRLYCSVIKYFQPDVLLQRDITLDDVLQLDLTYGIPYSDYCDLTQNMRTVQDIIDTIKNRIDMPALKSRKLDLPPKPVYFTTEDEEAEAFADELIFYGQTVLTSLFLDAMDRSDNFQFVKDIAKSCQNLHDVLNA